MKISLTKSNHSCLVITTDLLVLQIFVIDTCPEMPTTIPVKSLLDKKNDLQMTLLCLLTQVADILINNIDRG